jgi:hypothetical protein
MLTNMTLQEAIEEEFDGISCCFDRKAKKWTYLFWYLDKESKRHALWREGNELVSIDNKFRMQMTQETYRYHLERGYLVPSGLLVYSLFVCYYGVTCFWGIFQESYLPVLKKAFENIFSSTSEWINIKTNIINADTYYLFRDDIPVSALDFTINPLESLSLNQIKNLTLTESIMYCCEDL